MIRSLLALCSTCLLLLLAGCNKAPEPPKNSQAQLTPVRFLTDWYPQPEHGGFYNALVRGYYKEAGLDVTIEPGGPNIYPTQRVPVGAGEFGMASSDIVLTTNAEGQDLVAIGATMQWDPQAIMLHAEDPANSFADLEGRTIAAVPGSVWFRYLVKKFNYQNVKEIPATFTIANFLHDPQYIQQIFVTSEPFFVEQSGGAKPKILLIKDTGYQIYRVFFTTRSYMEKNPEIVRKFRRGRQKYPSWLRSGPRLCSRSVDQPEGSSRRFRSGGPYHILEWLCQCSSRIRGVSPGNKRCFRSSGGAFWISRATRPCGDWGIGAAQECAGRDSDGSCCAGMTVPTACAADRRDPPSPYPLRDEPLPMSYGGQPAIPPHRMCSRH
jgi:NitT/TauT family transport system substrate-binding protein